jgi:hypothetical protein
VSRFRTDEDEALRRIRASQQRMMELARLAAERRAKEDKEKKE